MKANRVAALWTLIIAVLVFIEVAEITHLFHLGYSQILGNLLAFVFSLVVITVLALVGAVFVGIFVASRILQPRGFTPFEEEMLKMRTEVRELLARLDRLEGQLRSSSAADPPEEPPSGPEPESPPSAGRRT